MVGVSHLTPAGLPGQEGPAERRWRQRGRPSSSARRARTLQLPAESVETSPRSTLLRMGRSPPAEGEDQQRLRQRAVRKVAMRQFRLRRWAVTAALRSKRGASAEGEDSQRLRQRAVREVAMRQFRLRQWAVTAILDTKTGAAAPPPTPAALPEPPVPATRCRPRAPPVARANEVVKPKVPEAAMADASAAGGGKAIATAVATTVLTPGLFTTGNANATSNAETVNGAMAQALSTVVQGVTFFFPGGQVTSTAKTALRA